MSLFRKLYAVFTPAQRRSAAMLLVLMFVGMFLEMGSIGLMVPALLLLVEGDVATKYPQVQSAMEVLGIRTQSELIIACVLLLLVFFLVRTCFLTFLSWRQAQFAYGLQREISQRLYAGYLRQPYTFHLERNSAQLTHVIMDLANFTFYGIVPGLLLITEGLVIVGVAALLLAIEPWGAASIGAVLGLAAWGMQRSMRVKLSHWGETRRAHDALRLQNLQQGLGGVKDLLVLGREEEVLTQFAAHNARSAHAGQIHMTLQQLPRLWIELLGVAALAILVLVTLAQGRSVSSIVPVLGTFAFASFRLMPSVSRMLGAAQTLHYGVPVINTLHAELQGLKSSKGQSNGRIRPLQSEITLSNVHFTYPTAASAALRGISITVARGSSVGIIGSSGSGKSTLVDIVLGLLTPDAGIVSVDGCDIQQDLRGWQNQIGYVPQTIYLTDDTLRRNVAFGLRDEDIDDAAVWRAIKAAQLEEFVRAQPDGLETLVGERGVRISGGQRQRIGIARALYHDPAVLVLDEATSALDTATEEGVMQAVSALHGTKTIIIIAHRLSTVASCDKLYRIEQGAVIQEGAFDEIVAL